MRHYYLVSIVAILTLFFACEKPEIEGIVYNEVSKEDILGGWKIKDIEFQLVYNAANPMAWMMPTLKEKMQANLREKIRLGSLYIKPDTMYYIIEYDDGTPTRVHRYGAYTLTANPAMIHPEYDHLICNAYAKSFYVKYEEDRLCLYLVKDGVIEMLRDDGSLSKATVNLIDRNIDDAQFYMYLERNHLPLYDEIDSLFYGGKTN